MAPRVSENDEPGFSLVFLGKEPETDTPSEVDENQSRLKRSGQKMSGDSSHIRQENKESNHHISLCEVYDILCWRRMLKL